MCLNCNSSTELGKHRKNLTNHHQLQNTDWLRNTDREVKHTRQHMLETQVKKKESTVIRMIGISIFYINKTKRTNKNVTSYKHLISDIVPFDIHVIK